MEFDRPSSQGEQSQHWGDHQQQTSSWFAGGTWPSGDGPASSDLRKEALTNAAGKIRNEITET